MLGSYSCRPRSWQLSQSQSQSSFVAILFVVIPATRNGDGSPSRRTLGSRPKGGSKGAGVGDYDDDDGRRRRVKSAAKWRHRAIRPAAVG